MRFGLVVALALLTAGCASAAQKPKPVLATVPPASLRWAGELPVIRLSGSAYDMGYQHGSLMRRHVQASVRNILAFADRQLGIPILGRWVARRRLDQAWIRMKPFVPRRYLEEMEGLADGAEIPVRLLERVHALPDLTSTACASFAAAGSATRDGRLIHIRNLDWAIQSGVQRYAVVFVHRPKGKNAFVNVGWLGFIGVITGVNDQGISIGEIGAETVDADLAGVPMPFLERRVLEEADDLLEAVEVICDSARTVGYNYLLADAQAKQAVSLETTRSHCAVFWLGDEPSSPFAVQVPGTLFRSDFALDPQVRDRQRAARGDPDRPGLESPVGSSAYDVRYRGQGLLLSQFHGSIDPEVAIAIARAIAPPSNLQSVVFAYPEMWVANAEGNRPAAQGPYQEVDLEDLLGAQ